MLNWKRGLKRITLFALLTLAMTKMEDYSFKNSILKNQDNKEITTSKNKNFEFSQQLFRTQNGKILTYNIAKIPKNSNLTPKIIISKEKKSVEDLVNGAEIGINGSFFTLEGTILGYVKSEGKILNNKKTNARLKGYLVKDITGFDIKKKINSKNYDLVLESFPILEYNNKSYVKSENERSFRSAVAIDSQKNLYLITTENALLSSGRVSYKEFKEFLETQNYISVLNLDGGSSTQMFVKNELKQNASDVYCALGFY